MADCQGSFNLYAASSGITNIAESVAESRAFFAAERPPKVAVVFRPSASADSDETKFVAERPLNAGKIGVRRRTYTENETAIAPSPAYIGPMPPDFRDVDPRELRVSTSRLSGADPFKLQRQIGCKSAFVRGQAPQNSKLAEPSVRSTQNVIPPILNFAVPDPGLWNCRYAPRQIAPFGRSAQGMPPILVYESLDGVLVVFNGVTRATRIAKLAPGTLVRVEVLGIIRRRSTQLPKIRDVLP